MTRIEKANKALAVLGLNHEAKVGDDMGEVLAPFMLEVAERLVALEKAAAESAMAGDVMQWRGIETAPRDGTSILVRLSRDADGQLMCKESLEVFTQVASWWDGEGEDGGGAWIVYCSMIKEPTLHFEPDQWMPLP